MLIVDAHEDIAWNMLAFGRDYLESSLVIRQREANNPTRGGHAMLGWSDWLQGRVGVVFATLYASKLGGMSSSKYGYRDIAEAHKLYKQQLSTYHGLVTTHPDKFRLITNQTHLADVLRGWQTDSPQVGLVILMEGAEGIQHPQELQWWYDQGVRIIGPAWSQTRYAGGTGAPGPLTQLGYELLEAMADLNMVLDLSHMTDEGVEAALEIYPGPIIASHSNARTLLPLSNSPERHLSDSTVLRLTKRGGVIGVVLANPFLDDTVTWTDTARPVTLAQVVSQIDYYCQLIGDTAHIGIGSDFDGGFGAELAPQGMESVADLVKIGAALADYGYGDDDIEAIMGDNWLNLLRHTLPSPKGRVHLGGK